MDIQTFSVVVGSRACDAKCPFCISKQTGFDALPDPGMVEYRNLKKAIHLAHLARTTTCLLTGKGEPTLYPNMILNYLLQLQDKFPLIELQTNGLQIGWLASQYDPHHLTLQEDDLKEWWGLGLDTIAISVVSTRHEPNAKVYNPNYPDLATTIAYLKSLKYSVRLCVMMMWEGVDSVEELQHTLEFCREHHVDQLTIRPIRHTVSATHDKIASSFVQKHGFDDDSERMFAIRQWIEKNGTRLLPLNHGAMIYDVGGQNLCVADCLTLSQEPEQIRTLIFYGDGTITYDWQYEGAVLVGGSNAH